MMIPESARQPLRQQITVLRIIVASLAIGVLAFAGVAINHNLGKPVVIAAKFEPLNVSLLAFGLAALAVGSVLPSILFRLAPAAPAQVGRFASFGPEVARVLGIQARIQTATIVGCAIFEGGAFANLFAYMQTAELLHLILSGLLVLGILACFPLPGASEQRIEDELRRQKEHAALGPPPL